MSRPHKVLRQDAADCGPPRLSSCIHPRPPSSESPLAFRRTAQISMRGAAGSASHAVQPRYMSYLRQPRGTGVLLVLKPDAGFRSLVSGGRPFPRMRS